MKKSIFFLLILLTLGSCDNDLNLIDDYQDIPVVYGILSLPEADQYIRVEKGFVDPVTSALELAQITDSLYYKDATVSIRNETTGDVFICERVDGAQEGYPRDPGIFATDPNILYKLSKDDFVPEPGLPYTLEIQRSGIDSLVTASIIMSEEPVIVRPSQTGTASLDFNYFIPTAVRWRGTENTGLFDLYFDIKYKERNTQVGGDFQDKSVRWTILSNFEDELYEIDGIGFYTFLASTLESDPNFVRRFRSIDMVLSVGGNEVAEYVRIGQANSGLTSSQDIPVYTNLSEGRGLFSSRNIARNDDINITIGTLDSLIGGQFTKNLNFVE